MNSKYILDSIVLFKELYTFGQCFFLPKYLGSIQFFFILVISNEIPMQFTPWQLMGKIWFPN